jgi:hypothetical protein
MNIREDFSNWLIEVNKKALIAAGIGGAVVGGIIGAKKGLDYAKKVCKEKYGNDREKYEKCMKAIPFLKKHNLYKR